MPISWFNREDLIPNAVKMIQPTNVLLDIGAGIRLQSFVEAQLHILCEPYSQYVKVLQEQFSSASNVMILQGTGQEILSIMPDRSVDTISMIDVIEHVENKIGCQLLRECERVARKQIILFTPLGFLPQEYEDGDIDGWGLEGGKWQKHRSGWNPEDFDVSWEILACKEFHLTNGKGEPFNPPAGAFWAIKNIESDKVAPDSLIAGINQNLGFLASNLIQLDRQVTQLDRQVTQLDRLLTVRLERKLRRIYRRIRGFLQFPSKRFI